MRKFDSIKRDLFGDETATLDPDYTQVPSDPKATSLTNRLLEAKARLNQQKLQVATEVFGNGHKNTSGVAAQKAYIQSPDNTEIPDTPSQEPALALDVNDFEDGEITEQDRNTPGAIADKVAKKAQEPVAPVNMPEEWDSLLSSIAKTEDLVLLGLDKGAESLEVAAKEFMTAKGATGLNSQQATQYLNNNVKDLIDWIKDNPPKTEETVMDKLSRAGDQFVQGISKAGDTLFDADKWTAATDAFFEGVSKAPDAFKSGVKKTLQQLNLPASEAELEVALKSFAEKYPNLMWIDESPDSIDTANKNEEAVKKFVAEYGKTLGISIEEPTEAPTKPPVVTDISSKQTIKTKERLLDAINIAEGKKDARIPYGYFSEAFEKRLAAGETISPEEARTEVSKHIDRHIKMWEAGGSRSDVAGAQERGPAAADHPRREGAGGAQDYARQARVRRGPPRP